MRCTFRRRSNKPKALRGRPSQTETSPQGTCVEDFPGPSSSQQVDIDRVESSQWLRMSTWKTCVLLDLVRDTGMDGTWHLHIAKP